jgi:hypothetical protein
MERPEFANPPSYETVEDNVDLPPQPPVLRARGNRFWCVNSAVFWVNNRRDGSKLNFGRMTFAWDERGKFIIRVVPRDLLIYHKCSTGEIVAAATIGIGLGSLSQLQSQFLPVTMVRTLRTR